ncbi:MAG: methyl-accepting chemotaxis protein [Nitrospirae bacterium]|nr:methyl-accepting chemotaxis protein [Nitrospirota bacterium]
MKLTLAKKLYGVIGIAMVILLVLAGASYVILKNVEKGYEGQIKGNGKQLEAGMDAQIALGEAIHNYKNYLIRKDDKYIQGFREAVGNIKNNVKTWDDLSDSPEEKDAAAKVLEPLAAYEKSIDQLVDARRDNDIAAADKAVKGMDRPVGAALKQLDELTMKNYENGIKAVSSKAGRLSLIQILLAIIAVISTVVLSTVLIRKILASVQSVGETVGAASHGDLSRDVSVTSDDELGEMARNITSMMGSLREMTRKIIDVTSTLASSSEEVSATTAQISNGINDQTSQVEQSATATTEISQTIMDVAKNASEASTASKEATEIALEGKRVVEETVSGMMNIARTVEESSKTIEELGESSKQIGEIINVIKDIADQTNLLALNAAIEAARAGEQGRGFAVVADEVRKLAERTTKATGQISAMISKIQNDTEVSVKSMSEGKESAEEGVKLVERARESLDRIVGASERCLDMVRLIATATEEQSTAIEEVSTTMESIASVSKSSLTAVSQINTATNDLARLAGELKQLVGWFKVHA